MKSEFFKLSKNRSLFYIFAIAILLIFGFSLFFYYDTIGHSVDSNNLGENVERYVSQTELSQLIDECDSKLESLENSYENGYYSYNLYINEKNEVLKQKNLYQFLYDNNLECDDVYVSTMLGANVDDVVAYQRLTLFVIEIFFVFIMAILASHIVTYEQDKGIKKFVYNSKSSRVSIVLKKFVVYIATILAVYAVCVILTTVMSKAYNVNYKYMISIFGDVGENIVCHSTYGLMALNFVGTLWDILFWGTIIFAISLLSNNVLLNIVIDVALIFGIIVIVNFSMSKFLACLVMPFAMFMSTNLSLILFIIALVVRVVIMVGLFIGSLLIFKRKDLV